MGRYLLRRLGFALLLVLTVSSASLLLTHMAPGDITSDQSLTLDPAALAKLRTELGLDRPLAFQYLTWLSGVAQLDFGRSLLYARPVSTLVGERALNTAVLASVALLLATVIGLPLGVYSGSQSRGLGRAVVRVFSVVALSVPPLIGSLALVFLAARTGWLPVGGMTSATGIDSTWAQWLADLARHLPIPALALALPLAATLERLQSQAIEKVVHEPFVAASRARGLGQMQSVIRHAWPVSLHSVLGLYGVMIGALFSGSFVVEVVTSWPGLGRLMYDALKARDLYLVAGCAASGAFFLAAGTLLADVLLAFADPRLRTEATRCLVAPRCSWPSSRRCRWPRRGSHRTQPARAFAISCTRHPCGLTSTDSRRPCTPSSWPIASNSASKPTRRAPFLCRGSVVLSTSRSSCWVPTTLAAMSCRACSTALALRSASRCSRRLAPS